MKMLIDSGFFGRILSVRGEFGYWVFEGDWQPAQRPSWNYRKEDDGGIIVDMLCHWRYVLDNLFGEVKSVSCVGATHIPKRWDEQGREYPATADDAAYATFELAGAHGPVIAQINSSWTTRVRRDDLATFHVDGTLGSAVAGLTDCWTQARVNTPKPVWNPDVPQTIDFFGTWQKLPNNVAYDNAFKVEWELFIRHLFDGGPFRWGLLEGAKGVQLAELGLQELGRAAVAGRARRWRPDAGAHPPPTRRRHLARVHVARQLGAGPPPVPGAQLQPRRVCRGTRRRRSAGRGRSMAPARDRLGRDTRLSSLSLVARLRRRRGDGHCTARHGTRLADVAGIDRPIACGSHGTRPAR